MLSLEHTRAQANSKGRDTRILTNRDNVLSYFDPGVESLADLSFSRAGIYTLERKHLDTG